jgi:hypothetical protein
MRLKQGIAAVLTTWMALGSVFLGVPEHAEASGVSEVEVSLQSDLPEADVSGGSDGIVNISGQVNCTINGTDEVKVHLWADSDIGAAFVTPSGFVFKGDNGTEKHRNFTVTIKLPMGFSIEERPRFDIRGHYLQNSLQYSLSNISCNISIEPFYSIEVETPAPVEIGAGEFVYFPVKITNCGNTDDIFEVYFSNLEDVCDHEWTVATVTPKDFSVGQTKIVTFSFQAPQTWTLWRNEVQPIHIRVYSQKSAEKGGDVRCDITLHVRQRGVYIPGFSTCLIFLISFLVALILLKKGWDRRKMPNGGRI